MVESLSTKRKIAANILYLGGSQLITWVLTSVYILVIPRYLGPAGIGILGLMSAVSGIVAVIANFGTRVYILREIARDPEGAKELVVPAVFLNVSFAVVCWMVVFAVISLGHQDPTVVQVMYIFAVSNTLLVSISSLQAALQGMDKMHYSFIEALLQKGLNTSIALVLASLGFGIILVAAADVATTIPLVGLYWYWFSRYKKGRYKSNLAVYKKLIKGGLSFYIVEISFNIYLYLDSILLAALTTEVIVGYYNVPTRLFGTLMIIPVIVSRAILPTLSRLAINSREALNDMSRNILNILICLSLPVAIGNTVMAEPIISFFYQSRFAPSIPIMIILGWTVVPTYLGIGINQILTAQDRQAGYSKVMILAAVTNLFLNLAAVPYFQNNYGNGGIGAALSLFLTEIIIGILGSRMVGQHIIDRRLVLSVLKSLCAALIMGLVVWPLRFAPLFIPILVGIIVYGMGVVVLGLVPIQYLKTGLGYAGRLKHKIIGAR